MIKIQFVIRIILTIALLIMVYHETGIWTVITLALICISIELLALSSRHKRSENAK